MPTRRARAGGSRIASASMVPGVPRSALPHPMHALQAEVGNRAVRRLLSTGRAVVQRDSYAYGSANTLPHIHVYRKGSHLKILDKDRGKVVRYNLVQNGRRHAQADDALAAAEGNEALVEAINEILDAI